MEEETKVFAVIIGLAIVQAILAPGPLRENIEIWLILQLVPIVNFIIQLGNLVYSTEEGTIIYYIKLIIILIQDSFKIWLYKLIKDRFCEK